MWESRLSRQRTSTACTVEDAIPQLVADRDLPQTLFPTRCTILRTTDARVRPGWACGREDRSPIPSAPMTWYRSAHRFAVGQDTSYVWAARANRPPHNKARQAQSGPRSQSSVSVGHEDLPVWERFLDNSAPRQDVFPIKNTQIVSSHHLDQRPLSAQLTNKS
jgi:hypothetical protein